MGGKLLVIWDDALAAYDFGPGHPLAPVRVELTMALAREIGVFDAPGVSMAVPDPAGDALLELVHDPGYIAAVRRAGKTMEPDPGFGLGTPDNPVFDGDARGVRARGRRHRRRGERCGWRGRARRQHGGRPAPCDARAAASGFCVYNDPAIAIAWLLSQGAERIAYVDLDVHHGDGVQAAFYADPRVLTISLHEHPRTLFPGTGLAAEIGSGAGAGYAVNVALPAGTGDPGWLRAFDAIVPPLLREFRPQVLVSQHGCDGHRLDPLAHLDLSVDAMQVACIAVHRLAHETAGGRWVLTGGGGYALVQVVPRAWTHVLAEAQAGRLIPARRHRGRGASTSDRGPGSTRPNG